MEYFDSSKDFKEKIKEKRNDPIPFGELPVGMSFAIPFGKYKEITLRNIVSQASKRLKRNFKCVKHTEIDMFEIGRLPDPEVFCSSEEVTGGSE